MEKKLAKVAELMEQGKITTLQQLTKSYTESYLTLAKFYMEFSNKSYLEKDNTNCIVFLYGSANYLILGAKWAGYEVSEGTRAIRKSIVNLTNAVNMRSEVNQAELKRVLEFIQKEINKFNNKMTGKKAEN